LEVRFERVAIFCEVFTVNEVPLYESPVPGVVVAALYRSPLFTATSPVPRYGKVEDAVTIIPPVNIIVEEVAEPYGR
jgi:hypothetical protein